MTHACLIEKVFQELTRKKVILTFTITQVIMLMWEVPANKLKVQLVAAS